MLLALIFDGSLTFPPMIYFATTDKEYRKKAISMKRGILRIACEFSIPYSHVLHLQFKNGDCYLTRHQKNPSVYFQHNFQNMYVRVAICLHSFYSYFSNVKTKRDSDWIWQGSMGQALLFPHRYYNSVSQFFPIISEDSRLPQSMASTIFFASELCLSHSVYIKCHLLCSQHTFTPQQRKLFILQVESPLFDARVEPANAFSTPAACTDSGRACTNALSTLYLGHVWLFRLSDSKGQRSQSRGSWHTSLHSTQVLMGRKVQ